MSVSVVVRVVVVPCKVFGNVVDAIGGCLSLAKAQPEARNRKLRLPGIFDSVGRVLGA